MADLRKRGCGFVSLTEAIDTTSATGRFNFHLFAALAEFERSLLIKRTKAGMAALLRDDSSTLRRALARDRSLSAMNLDG